MVSSLRASSCAFSSSIVRSSHHSQAVHGVFGPAADFSLKEIFQEIFEVCCRFTCRIELSPSYLPWPRACAVLCSIRCVVIAASFRKPTPDRFIALKAPPPALFFAHYQDNIARLRLDSPHVSTALASIGEIARVAPNVRS
jgi:hypothetical protein